MKNDEIRHRSANRADGEKIRQIVFGVLREYNLEPDCDDTDADLNDIEANYIARGGLFEVLETASGEIVGTVGLYPLDRETVELRKMYFAREIRGRGLGKQTLQRIIESAATLGFKRIYLETNTRLKEAVGLYRKFGFAETEEKHAARCNQAFVLELENESSQV